jgi:hypothetical protein
VERTDARFLDRMVFALHEALPLEAVGGAQWGAVVAKALNARAAERVTQRDAALHTVDEAQRALARSRAQAAAASCKDLCYEPVAARLAADWKDTAEHIMDTARTALG